MVEINLVSSKSKARRLVEQNGIKVNNEKVSDLNYEIKTDIIIQKGKKIFLKVTFE